MTKKKWQLKRNGMFTPYKDKNGEKICGGDVVRFYFDVDKGVFRGEHKTKACEDYTEMIDVVAFVNDRVMFLSDIGHGSYGFRYNEYCEIIWRYPRKPESLLLEITHD